MVNSVDIAQNLCLVHLQMHAAAIVMPFFQMHLRINQAGSYYMVTNYYLLWYRSQLSTYVIRV